MRLVIMQPSYLPWMGYFDLLLQADLFLVYDNVQFDKDGWRNRNRIKTANGLQWLTVPVLTKGQNKPTNKDVRINNLEFWAKKQLKSIELSYKKAPHFAEVYPMIESVLTQEWNFLIDLNMAFIRKFCEYLNIPAKIAFASDLKLDLPEGKNEKLISICKHLKADEFYEPAGGQGYIDPAQFESQGIRLTFQNYHPAEYPQLHGPFVSHLSVIDLFFNCGRDSLKLIKAPSQAIS
jgi:hypothetical protein